MRCKTLSLILLGALALSPLAKAQDVVSLHASSNSETSLAISPSSADAGTPVTLKADVQPTQGGPNATGTVSFFSYGYLLGTAPVKGTVATLIIDTRQVAPGEYSIKAHYSGDSNYQPSTSPYSHFSVSSFTNSQTSLASSPSSIDPGTVLNVKADVQPKQGGPSPTGTVLFFAAPANDLDDAVFLGSAPVKGTVAQINVPTRGVPPGKYALIAIYLGNNTYVGSFSNLSYIKVQ